MGADLKLDMVNVIVFHPNGLSKCGFLIYVYNLKDNCLLITNVYNQQKHDTIHLVFSTLPLLRYPLLRYLGLFSILRHLFCCHGEAILHFVKYLSINTAFSHTAFLYDYLESTGRNETNQVPDTIY